MGGQWSPYHVPKCPCKEEGLMWSQNNILGHHYLFASVSWS